MVYAALEISTRRRLDDAISRAFSSLDVAQAIDEGAKHLQGELGILRNITSLSAVANQRYYTPATNMEKPTVVEYSDSAGPHVLSAMSIEDYRMSQNAISRATIPWGYCFLENERQIGFVPIPDTSAGTTTLTGSHSAAITTLTVASTTGFPSEGRLIVESEVIYYSNTTATTFANCIRAMEGTTAATHAGAVTVTERDLVIWGVRLYQDLEMSRFYNTGTVAITNGLTALVGTTTVWTTGASAGDYFGITPDATQTMPRKWYQISSVTDNTNIVLADTYTEPTQTTGNYIISSPNPFPNYCDGFLTSFAASRLLVKNRDYAGANIMWADAMRQLEGVRGNQTKNDVLIRPMAIREQLRWKKPMGAWVTNQTYVQP